MPGMYIERFNRYMVECEFSSLDIHYIFVVSFNRYMVECEYGCKVIPITCGKSFNRYMVECEYQCNCTVYFVFVVLIDTWWNVNTFDTEEV